MTQQDLLKQINEAAYKHTRRILFEFDNGQSDVAFLSDFMSLIHSSIETVKLKPQVKMEKNSLSDAEQSSTSLKKRKNY
jgi:hypothetical protein